MKLNAGMVVEGETKLYQGRYTKLMQAISEFVSGTRDRMSHRICAICWYFVKTFSILIQLKFVKVQN